MKTLYIYFTVLSFLISFTGCSLKDKVSDENTPKKNGVSLLTQPDQIIPENIENFLTQYYGKWQYSKLAKFCEQGGVGKSEFRIKADINNNGKTDYIIKGLNDMNGFIIAFLDNGSNYDESLLYSGSIESIEDCKLEYKGKKIYITNCETSSCFITYNKGRFITTWTSD